MPVLGVGAQGLSSDLALTCPRYGLGASWDFVDGRNVDIDLQCVVVNSAGTITDCAYYNNLKAARGITHSGDEAQGKPDKIDEMVWVNLKKLPADVNLLIFVVAAYSGGLLKDVQNGCLHLFEERESNPVVRVAMEQSSASVDVVAAMLRDGPEGAWKLRTIDRPAQQGQHFIDILPLLCTVIRDFIPSAPQRQKVAFAMEKGNVLDLPMDLGRITVGLGWDVDDGKVDLDVSAVLVDAKGCELEAVFWSRLQSEQHGIRHTGDNLTGEGDGDDEQIIVDLNGVGAQVQHVFLVVNVYTRHRTFAQVANPYCRVVDDSTGSELCRYELKRGAGSHKGLIIAKISREAGGRWGFHALGVPCEGSMYKDSLPQIRQCSQVKTATLRQSATQDEHVIQSPYYDEVPSAPAAEDELSLPAPWQAPAIKGQPQCCTLM